MNVAIIGTGYVGLVSGVCLALRGHNTICVDTKAEIVNSLNRGVSTLYEKNLDNILKKTVSKKKFQATTNLDKALKNSSIIIIAVGTPSKNGKIDLSYIKKVSQDIGRYIRKINRFVAVIIKSTVLPGTTDNLVRNEIEKFSSKKLGDFGLGMNPEFLREGSAINDFLYPDRIVIGYDNSNKTLSLLKELYDPWNVDKMYVNCKTAELIKYANNMLLATQISTINELANFSTATGGIDFAKVVEGIHLDKRWNPIINNKRSNPEILKYLIPGCGFGGSCFPKDVMALKSKGEHLGIDMSISNAVIDVNIKQPHQIIKIIQSQFKNLKKKNFLILGLAFKPDTDDVRDSPAVKIADDLIKKKAFVFAHDPIAVEKFKSKFKKVSSKINFVKNWKKTIRECEIIILVTPWKEYHYTGIFDLEGKIIIDTRGIFSLNNFKNATYMSIGTRLNN